MPPSARRPSTSFHLLPRESSGDGELFPLSPDDKITAARAHPRRRQRRKRNLSQPSALALPMLEGERFADGVRSAVSTPGGTVGSGADGSLQQDSFGSQQWDMIASASITPDSTALVAHPSTISSTKELANGDHAAHSKRVQESFGETQGSQAGKAQFMGNGTATQHFKEESHGREASQVSDVFVQTPSIQDDNTSSSRVNDIHTSSSVKDGLVSPGIIPDLQVFVSDGNSALLTQSSRAAELRQRITHNQVENSSQPVSSQDDQVSIASKDVGSPNSSTVSNSSARPEARENYVTGPGLQTPHKPPHIPIKHTETPQLLDWQQLMSANSMCASPAVVSPFEYFLGEVLSPPSTFPVGTQSAEIDKKRQHVYNTMFHVPWRCELLIVTGFFVCLDSFLSLLTVMPVRILVFFLSFFLKKRQFRRLRADELSDLFSLLVLMVGVTLLQQADISYIYHMIRSQATIKLYVVYNVLEIFDKLCQSFGSDVLQVVLNSADNVATCPSASLMSEAFRFAFDQCIGIASFVFHSLIILAQSITVSAAIRSHNNALLTLLISNNFAEIKSNVFKRLGKDNLHKLAYLDTVERFHIIAHLFFVLAQNLLAANEPWLYAFACNASMVFVCEIVVDVIKHAFLAKFNEIKPAAYSEFLLALCKQTLTSQSRELHKTMSFAPFAPACVVIRVLIPLYAAYLPETLLWRLLVVLLFGSLTFVLLVALKVLVALGLLKHANWYVARHNKKEKLLHFD